MKEYNGLSLGPLMPEDAEFLKAIIKMTTPKVLIEFGHFWGESARAMMEAMDGDAVLHSYDNAHEPSVEQSERFIYHRASQETVEGIENIDFVFLDASHDFQLNMSTFERLRDHLSDKAIIAVHDTGTWCKGNVFEFDQGHSNPDGSYTHCPDEIKFVNHLASYEPQLQIIHFHSRHSVRHGITLLQWKTIL